jgi:DNA sulfur modification protein DndE
LELLAQISEKTNGQANFVFLDFKGLKPEDAEKNKAFFARTKAEYIDIPQKPFPLNPLTFIDNINDKNKNMGVDKFVDIVCKYSNLGIKQKGRLRTATMESFLDKKGAVYPSINDIRLVVTL